MSRLQAGCIAGLTLTILLARAPVGIRLNEHLAHEDGCGNTPHRSGFGFHSLASFCASAICAGVILSSSVVRMARASLSSFCAPSMRAARVSDKLSHMCARTSSSRYSVAYGVHLTENKLRNAEVLVSGAPNPLSGLSVVLRHNLAELVHDTENILRQPAALVSVLTETLHLLRRLMRGPVPWSTISVWSTGNKPRQTILALARQTAQREKPARTVSRAHSCDTRHDPAMFRAALGDLDICRGVLANGKPTRA